MVQISRLVCFLAITCALAAAQAVHIPNGGTPGATQLSTASSPGGVPLVDTSAQAMAGPLNAPALNGTLNAALYSGLDIGAKINSAIATCVSQCTITIPPGTYNYSTTITITTPGISLIGAGPEATFLNYTGSGDGILWQMNPFTLNKAGTLRGFTLIGTSSTVNLIHTGTIVGSTLDDLVVSGATGAAGTGILFENANLTSQGWTERVFMRNVHVGASGVGNTTDVALNVKGGMTSFGYNEFDFWQNVEAGQTGFSLCVTCYLYNGDLKIKGNIDSTNSTTSYVTLNGRATTENLVITGESVTGSHTNAILVGSSAIVGATGYITVLASDETTGAIPVNIASGGAYYIQPFYSYSFPISTMLQEASKTISTDGSFPVIQGGDLRGRLQLSWPNAGGSMDEMILDLGCTQFGNPCSMDVPVNYSYVSGSPVISNPTIIENSISGIIQVLVTIGNRGGHTGPLYATWVGTGYTQSTLPLGQYTFFPAIPGSYTAIVTQGIQMQPNGQTNVSGSLHIGGSLINNNGTLIPSTALGNIGNPSGYVELALKGTTGTIAGTPLSASCDSGTATVTGAAVGQTVAVSSTTGADVGGTFNVRGSVTSAGKVTVYVCGTGTPASLAYNVTVF